MRRLSISEIVALVCDPSDPIKALAMVKAFFDDSGTHGESLITAIGGFVAGEKVLSAIEADWAEAMHPFKRRGISAYHAADIAQWRGEWANVTLNDCRRAPFLFAGVLSKHDFVPVWAAVVNEDFRKYATPEFLKFYPTPFDLCFYEAMGQLYRWARNAGASKVAPTLAHGDYVQRISDAHRRYQSDGDFGSYIGPLVIDSPRAVLPLQVADLLANEFYNWWLEEEYPVDAGKIRERPVLWKALERLGASGGLGGCYAELGMKNAVENFHAGVGKKAK